MLKLAFIFVLIVLLLGRRWNLGYVLLLASALLGLLFRLPALEVLKQAWIAVIDLKTLRLVAAVLLITSLGELLQEVESMQRLINSLQELIADPRLVLAIIPALIGLLPMPGGAMMSAPMIQEIGTQLELSPERKTYINYWFRHVWEYIFPLYPALILMSGILDIPLSRLMLAQAPLTVGAIAGGVLVGLRGIGRPPEEPEEMESGPRSQRWHSLRTLALSIWPIALVIVLSLGFGLELALSLVVAIVLAAVVHRMSPRTLGGVLRRSLSPGTALLVFSIMIFKQIVLASGAADTLSTALAAWGIAPVVTTAAVPFVLGLLTGLTMSMVGIGFPVLLPLISGSELYLNHAVLAFGAGFIGVLLSPMHLCLALTREYFHAKWAGLYRLLLSSAASLSIAVAVTWFIA
jgi:integral membrane protein (TIGR00529 family)